MEIGTQIAQHIHNIIYNEGQYKAIVEAYNHIRQIVDEYDPEKHSANNLIEELENFLEGHNDWLTGLNTSSHYNKEQIPPLLMRYGTNGLTIDPDVDKE